MKLTKQKLKQIIREELDQYGSTDTSFGPDPVWNDLEEMAGIVEFVSQELGAGVTDGAELEHVLGPEVEKLKTLLTSVMDKLNT